MWCAQARQNRGQTWVNDFCLEVLQRRLRLYVVTYTTLKVILNRRQSGSGALVLTWIFAYFFAKKKVCARLALRRNKSLIISIVNKEHFIIFRYLLIIVFIRLGLVPAGHSLFSLMRKEKKRIKKERSYLPAKGLPTPAVLSGHRAFGLLVMLIIWVFF